MRTNFITTIILIFIISSAVLFGQDAYSLRYKFEKGKTILYRTKVNTDITQEVMGREMKMRNELKNVIRIEPSKTDEDGKFDLLVSFDSASTFTHTPMKDTTLIPTEIIGKRLRLSISNKGEILDKEMIDSVDLSGEFSQLIAQQSQQFIKFPEKSLSVGDAWEEHRVDTMAVQFGQIVAQSDYNYTLDTTESKLGHDCVRITFNADIKLEGEGSMRGISLNIEGNGKAKGTIHFDQNAGEIIAQDADTENHLNVAASGEQQMIIPISQTTKSSRVIIE